MGKNVFFGNKYVCKSMGKNVLGEINMSANLGGTLFLGE